MNLKVDVVVFTVLPGIQCVSPSSGEAAYPSWSSFGHDRFPHLSAAAVLHARDVLPSAVVPAPAAHGVPDPDLPNFSPVVRFVEHYHLT